MKNCLIFFTIFISILSAQYFDYSIEHIPSSYTLPTINRISFRAVVVTHGESYTIKNHDVIIACEDSTDIYLSDSTYTNGRILIIKDISGNAGTNPIKIHSVIPIDGDTVVYLSQNYVSISLFYVNGAWWIF